MREFSARPLSREAIEALVRTAASAPSGSALAAAQHAGLATLTHTPSPMRFLSDILERPRHERPYLLILVGYPAEGRRVPGAARRKKPLRPGDADRLAARPQQ